MNGVENLPEYERITFLFTVCSRWCARGVHVQHDQGLHSRAITQCHPCHFLIIAFVFDSITISGKLPSNQSHLFSFSPSRPHHYHHHTHHLLKTCVDFLDMSPSSSSSRVRVRSILEVIQVLAPATINATLTSSPTSIIIPYYLYLPLSCFR